MRSVYPAVSTVPADPPARAAVPASTIRTLSALDRAAPVIRLPRLPADPSPYAFPLLATIAPVAGSLVLWVVTQSVFALIFALVGPLVAVASLADSKISGRRGRRRELRRFQADVLATHRAIDALQSDEVMHLDHAWPGIRQVLDSSPTAPSEHGRGQEPRSGLLRAPIEPVRWSCLVPTDVVVGRGEVRSSTGLTGDAPLDPARKQAVTDALASLVDTAAILHDAPVHLDVRPGIGFAGPRLLAVAAARALVLQLARSLPPSGTIIRIPEGPDWEWMRGLPHRVEQQRPPSRSDVVVFGREAGLGSTTPAGAGAQGGADRPLGGAGRHGLVDSVTISVAERAADLPHACRLVVVLGDGEGASIGERQRRAPLRPLRPEFASVTEAVMFAAVLQAVAEAEGEGRSDARMPATVLFAGLDPSVPHPSVPDASAHEPSVLDPSPGAGAAPESTTTGLCAVIGADHDGAVELDLVADGPHAVVGGATGSGKSELLITWVLAIAARYPPRHVTFLLVDFKGGASFAPVSVLPHCVGIVTDLDSRSAARALESLSAEVLHRERALADAGVRGIDELPAQVLPRLVILVDEFAAMSRDLPGLHALFVDLAARGRSLGIHLVLATQRPADTLRESILANCPLRISLRVSSPADSVAVIGTDEAAHLPRRPEGRALLSRAGDRPVLVQVARSDEEDRSAVASRWPRSPVRRPWCEPLPLTLSVIDLNARDRNAHDEHEHEHEHLDHDVDGADRPETQRPSVTRPTGCTSIAFGLADLPSEQRQETARWDPVADGHLLVLGGHRSGSSTVLAVLGQQVGVNRTTIVPDDIEGAWDSLAGLVAGLASGESGMRRDSSARHRDLSVEGRHLVMIDDVDALIARFGIDHQMEFTDLLVRLLRDGARAGVSVVLASRQLPGVLQLAAALCPARLVLRLDSRQEHVLAGLPSDRYDERMPAGRGFWRGSLVQVANTAPLGRPRRVAPRAVELAAGGATAIVSTSPRQLAALLGHRSGVVVVDLAESGASAGVAAPGGALREIVVTDARRHTVVVGSPDAWQSAWSLLGSIRARVPLVFDGCTPSEFRSLSRSARLPPPIDVSGSTGDDRRVWILTPDDRIDRALLQIGAERP